MEVSRIIREVDKHNLWDSLFETCCDYTFKAAHDPKNEKNNRYQDVLPYDHTRVVLNKKLFKNDYINASYVECSEINQGPTETTTPHFWQMIYDQNVQCVVMLCNVIEDSKNKCYRYYPQDVNEKLQFSGGFKVTLKKMRLFKNYVIRDILVTRKNVSKRVAQLHYLHWPDFGVPKNVKEFVSFIMAIRKSGILDSASVGPPIIHCSAGIGRTGTYMLVDTIIEIVRQKKSMSEIDIIEKLIEFRNMRRGLVQTPEQLRFAYECIVYGIRSEFPQLYKKSVEYYKQERQDFDRVKYFRSIRSDEEMLHLKIAELTDLSLTRQALQIVSRMNKMSLPRIKVVNGKSQPPVRSTKSANSIPIKVKPAVKVDKVDKADNKIDGGNIKVRSSVMRNKSTQVKHHNGEVPRILKKTNTLKKQSSANSVPQAIEQMAASTSKKHEDHEDTSEKPSDPPKFVDPVTTDVEKSATDRSGEQNEGSGTHTPARPKRPDPADLAKTLNIASSTTRLVQNNKGTIYNKMNLDKFNEEDEAMLSAINKKTLVKLRNVDTKLIEEKMQKTCLENHTENKNGNADTSDRERCASAETNLSDIEEYFR